MQPVRHVSLDDEAAKLQRLGSRRPVGQDQHAP
jgi:hypothetical protein